jgi:hypothetical protein
MKCVFAIILLTPLGMLWAPAAPAVAGQERRSDGEAHPRSRLVRLAENGRLVYVPLDEWNNHVPDYSFAGHQSGGVALPRVSVKLELTPLSDCCDDTQRIVSLWAPGRAARRPFASGLHPFTQTRILQGIELQGSPS